MRGGIPGLGLKLGAFRGKPDAVNGDVVELRLAEHCAELRAAADVGGLREN
jgi:hypothetical protein